MKEQTFYLNSEINRNQTGPLINQKQLELLPEVLSDKELNTIVFILKKMSDYQKWVNDVYMNMNNSSANIRFEEALLIPKFIFYNPNDVDKLVFNPHGLILDSIGEINRLLIQRYLQAKIDKNFKISSISLDAAVNFTNLILLVREMGEGKTHWKNSVWETTSDGFAIIKNSIFRSSEVCSAYFTPGRNRFGIIWHTPNPYANNSIDQEITDCEIRLEASPTDNSLVLDSQVRIGQSTRYNPQMYSQAEFVSLIDFLFGSNRHHIAILKGPYEARNNIIFGFMQELGVGHLLRKIEDIPRARKPLASP